MIDFIKRNSAEVLIVGVVVIIIGGCVVGMRQQARLSAECKQLGGVPKFNDGQVLCFSPGVLIK